MTVRGKIAAGFGSMIALLLMLANNFFWGRWLLVAGVVGVVVLFFIFGQDQMLASPSDAAEQLGFQARVQIWSRGLEALEAAVHGPLGSAVKGGGNATAGS